MTLKSKITKTEHALLSSELQAAYKINPANAEEYLIDTDDADELRNAKKREKDRADALQAELDTSKAKEAAEAKKLEDAALELAKKNGDISALETSWKQKVADAVEAGKTEAKKLKDALNNLLVKNTAKDIANEICTVPDLIEDKIAARLQVELTDDLPITRVLDAMGKPSASNLDDLKKEFVANPKYAAIIKANDASGGGAGSEKPGGGATVKLSDMNEAQRVALAKSDPTRFENLVAADRAEKAKV